MLEDEGGFKEKDKHFKPSPVSYPNSGGGKVYVSFIYFGTTNLALLHATETKRRQPLDLLGVRRTLVTVFPAKRRTLVQEGQEAG